MGSVADSDTCSECGRPRDTHGDADQVSTPVSPSSNTDPVVLTAEAWLKLNEARLMAEEAATAKEAEEWVMMFMRKLQDGLDPWGVNAICIVNPENPVPILVAQQIVRRLNGLQFSAQARKPFTTDRGWEVHVENPRNK